MVRTHTLTVRGEEATIDDFKLTQDGEASDLIQLDLDGTWADLDVYVTFARYGSEPVEVDWTGDPMEVPAELLRTPGYLWLVVVGVDADQIKVSRKLDQPIVIRESGATSEGCGCGHASARKRLAVPVVSDDGELTWHWGFTSDGLPAQTNIRGPQGPKGDKGEPGAVFSQCTGVPEGEPADKSQLYVDIATGDVYGWVE